MFRSLNALKLSKSRATYGLDGVPRNDGSPAFQKALAISKLPGKFQNSSRRFSHLCWSIVGRGYLGYHRLLAGKREKEGTKWKRMDELEGVRLLDHTSLAHKTVVKYSSPDTRVDA